MPSPPLPTTSMSVTSRQPTSGKPIDSRPPSAHHQGNVFEYTPEYLANPGLGVATTLPSTDQPVVTPAGAVPAYFAGLLPEGRRLTALRSAIKTSVDDDLSLLLAVGADPVGDVQILPTGVAPHVPDPSLVGSRNRTSPSAISSPAHS